MRGRDFKELEAVDYLVGEGKITQAPPSAKLEQRKTQ